MKAGSLRKGKQMIQSPYKTADLVSVGSIVEYSDMANPRTTYVVVAMDRTDQWSPFTLRNISPESGYEYTSTDLSQAGWEFVSA